MAYGAVVATGCIALACAAVAWARLDEPPETIGWLPSLPSDAVLGIALPVLLVGSVMAINWLTRLFTEGRPTKAESARADLAGTAREPVDTIRSRDSHTRLS
jgi:hypothetical protein